MEKLENILKHKSISLQKSSPSFYLIETLINITQWLKSWILESALLIPTLALLLTVKKLGQVSSGLSFVICNLCIIMEPIS
jgi:hypothetical protein